jgi:hypothetical protein
MDTVMKDKRSGGVADLLPMAITVPRADLLPNAHEKMMMKGSTNFRKRNRKPKMDVDDHACEQRQLTDAYELIRRNRNPALYRPTKADAMRSVQMLNQHSKAVEDADVTAVKLRVLESAGANAAALQLRRDLHDGVVASSGQRPIDRRLAAESIPHFDTYTRGSSVTDAEGTTYGHGHNPRIFNPLTNDLTRKLPASMQKNDGLSVAQLRDLLSGGGSKTVGGSVPSGSYGGETRHQTSENRDSFPRRDSKGSLDLSAELNYDSVLAQETSKPSWDDTFAALATIKGIQNSLPHSGVSELQRDASMHQSFREKLAASQSMAAGTRISAVASERQTMDKHDLSLAGNGLKRSQRRMSSELSPRRSYQRDEVSKIKEDWRRREAAAAARVKQHVTEEILAKIPQPPPLTLPPGQHRDWNSSFLLGENPY